MHTTIKFAKVRPNAIIPTKRLEDAGYDIYANFEEDYIVLNPHETKMIPTGIACACDTDYLFNTLLPKEYMPKALKKLYAEREKYPVSSSFQVAFAVDGIYPELTGTRIFSCKELKVGKSSTEAISTLAYDYEPSFAPSGKTVLQSNISQTEEDYKYWQKLYSDKELYNGKKTELANEVMKRIIEKYPVLKDKLRVLDVWTPMTYTRYCNCYKGAYMSFVNTKNAKNIIVSGALKGIDNVFLASQWLMGPGGLPTAAAMGKFAAYRIINKK
jgi:phytoene dehydrogenase-like protein